MKVIWKTLAVGGVIGAAALLASKPLMAEVDAETAYILNTFMFLVMGFLVMFMAAGFAMLEAGLVRSRNVATICLKNISLYSIAGLVYWLVGYNLMYDGVDGGWIGTLSLWAADDSAALAETGANFEAGLSCFERRTA